MVNSSFKLICYLSIDCATLMTCSAAGLDRNRPFIPFTRLAQQGLIRDAIFQPMSRHRHRWCGLAGIFPTLSSPSQPWPIQRGLYSTSVKIWSTDTLAKDTERNRPSREHQLFTRCSATMACMRHEFNDVTALMAICDFARGGCTEVPSEYDRRICRRGSYWGAPSGTLQVFPRWAALGGQRIS